MTTTNQMNNFRQLAERFAQGGKLLTTQEKAAIMANRKKGNQEIRVKPAAVEA